MLDTTKAKADAEEGLRIAEKATEGPWEYGPRTQLVFQADALDDLTICDLSSDTHCNNGPFIADSRTRAPAAYRNVIALADENKRLRKKVEGLSCDLGTCTDERNCLRLVLHEVWRRGVDLVGLPRYDPRKHGPTQELAFDAWVNDQ